MDVYEWTHDRNEQRWNEELNDWEWYVAGTYFDCVVVDHPEVNATASQNFGGTPQQARDMCVASWNTWYPGDPKQENDFTWKTPPQGWTNPNDPTSMEGMKIQ